MTGWTLFFTVAGVGWCSSLLMRFIVWLDTPKEARR